MDLTRAIGEERAALQRIVALLLALADLAELAARRSPAVRGFVLWLLRRAEPVARDFAFGEADMRPAPAVLGCPGSRPEDAIRLAEAFRVLAWQIELCADLLAGSGDGHSGRTGKSFRLRADETLAALDALVCRAVPLPVAAPDTS
jgi:hypothetical protein